MQLIFVQQILPVTMLRPFNINARFSLVRPMHHKWNRISQQARKHFDFHIVIKSAVTLPVSYTWNYYWSYSINLQSN